MLLLTLFTYLSLHKIKYNMALQAAHSSGGRSGITPDHAFASASAGLNLY